MEENAKVDIMNKNKSDTQRKHTHTLNSLVGGLTYLLFTSVMASDFAEIPDFSPNSGSSLIYSARSIDTGESTEFGDISLGESNGRLAIVDNVESPNCVAFLQSASNVESATQSLLADTINLDCQ